MNAVLRILRKELTELAESPRALIMMLVVPPLILVLVGQLQVQPPAVEVLMTGAKSCDRDGGDADRGCRVARVLRELSRVTVRVEDDLEASSPWCAKGRIEPLRCLKAESLDLLVEVSDGDDP